MPVWKKIVNYLAFNVGWFALVLGAARGLDWPGIVTMLVVIAGHLALLSPAWKPELRFVVVIGIGGLVLDSILGALGILGFAVARPIEWISPNWMVALWLGFATVVVTCLDWMRGRHVLGGVLGFAGGAVAYWAGVRLGALEFPAGLAAGLIGSGVAWAVATPLIVALAQLMVWVHWPAPASPAVGVAAAQPAAPPA